MQGAIKAVMLLGFGVIRNIAPDLLSMMVSMMASMMVLEENFFALEVYGCYRSCQRTSWLRGERRVEEEEYSQIRQYKLHMLVPLKRHR